MANPILAAGVRFVGKKATKLAKKGVQKIMEWNSKRPHNTGQGMSFKPKGFANRINNRIQKKQIEQQFAAQGRSKQTKQQLEMITKQSTDSMTLIRKQKVK